MQNKAEPTELSRRYCGSMWVPSNVGRERVRCGAGHNNVIGEVGRAGDVVWPLNDEASVCRVILSGGDVNESNGPRASVLDLELNGSRIARHEELGGDTELFVVASCGDKHRFADAGEASELGVREAHVDIFTARNNSLKLE